MSSNKIQIEIPEEKTEWNWNIYYGFTLTSFNNGINKSINISIESIDKFSFGENSFNEENDLIKEKKEKNINYDNKINILNKEEINSEIEKIKQIKEIKQDNLSEKKFLGLFTKDDFIISSNRKLNDSFEKKYNNPLEGKNDDPYPDLILPSQRKKNENKNKEENKIEEKIKNEEKKIIEEEKKIEEKKLNNSNEDNLILNNDTALNIEKEFISLVSNQQDSSRNHHNLNKNSSDENNNILNDHYFLSSDKINKEMKEEIIQVDNDLNFEKEKLNQLNLKKIQELEEKLEKTEREMERINETNSKLFEVIKIYKVLQSIDTNKNIKKKSNNNEENNEKNSNDLNYNNLSNQKRARTFSKKKPEINNNSINNKGKLYIDYIQFVRKTYSQMYKKDQSKKLTLTKNPIKKQFLYHKYMLKDYSSRETNSYSLNGSNTTKSKYSPYLNHNLNYSYGYNIEDNSTKYTNTNPSNSKIILNLNNLSDNNSLLYNSQINKEQSNEPLFYESGNYNQKIYPLSDSPIKKNNMNNNENNEKENQFFKHKLLNYDEFQIIFDDEKENNNYDNYLPVKKDINEKVEMPSGRIYNIPNYQVIKNEKINKTNIKNNNNIKTNILDEINKINKENQGNINIEKEKKSKKKRDLNKFIIPFYLLKKQDLFNNIINYSIDKKNKICFSSKTTSFKSGNYHSKKNIKIFK